MIKANDKVIIQGKNYLVKEGEGCKYCAFYHTECFEIKRPLCFNIEQRKEFIFELIK